MPSRRLLITVLAVAVLAAACGPSSVPSPSASSASSAAAATPSVSPSPTPAATPTASPAPTPTPDPFASSIADLTGLTVDPALAHRLPVAVMLDDSRAARPQSGFNAASIVYQAPADGYETRYMLVFQEGDSDEVGPVRSARFYLAQWASEVRAAAAHFGGDRRSRSHIRHNPQMLTGVDGLGKGAKAFHRIRSRRAPHNAYTSTAKVRAMALKLGAPERMSRRLHLRPFVDPSPVEQRGPAHTIRIPYRTNVITYRFDPESGRYRRSVDGKAQIDPADGKRVTTTNVIVLFQKFRIDTKIEPGHSRPDITTIGTGRALVFQEGRVIEGTWSKDGDVEPTLILDADGKEIPLVRGRTFIQSVPHRTDVDYPGS